MNYKTTYIHDDIAHRYAIFLCSQIAKGQCKDYQVGQPSTDDGHIYNMMLSGGVEKANFLKVADVVVVVVSREPFKCTNMDSATQLSNWQCDEHT